MFAGCAGLKVAALTFTHVEKRDGRWCIVGLVGKHGRVRTTPMPNWVKVAIDTWTKHRDRPRAMSFGRCCVVIVMDGDRSAGKWSGRCRASTPPRSAYRALRRTTFEGRAPRCAGPPAENWNRFRRCLVMPQYRLQSAIPRHEAGSGQCSKRRNQIESGDATDCPGHLAGLTEYGLQADESFLIQRSFLEHRLRPICGLRTIRPGDYPECFSLAPCDASARFGNEWPVGFHSI